MIRSRDAKLHNFYFYKNFYGPEIELVELVNTGKDDDGKSFPIFQRKYQVLPNLEQIEKKDSGMWSELFHPNKWSYGRSFNEYELFKTILR